MYVRAPCVVCMYVRVCAYAPGREGLCVRVLAAVVCSSERFTVGLLILWMLILTVVPANAEVLVSEREIHDAVQAFALEEVAGFDGDLEVSVRWRGDIRIPGVGAVRAEVERSAARGSARRAAPSACRSVHPARGACWS